MVHTKSRRNRSNGSGEEEFEGFYHINMQAWWPCDLGHVTQIPRTNFCSPYPWRLDTKFGFKLIVKAVSEEKMLKLVKNMTKIVQDLFGFEAKTSVLAPVPGHCLSLTFYQSDFNTYPVNSYKINASNLSVKF